MSKTYEVTAIDSRGHEWEVEYVDEIHDDNTGESTYRFSCPEFTLLVKVIP